VAGAGGVAQPEPPPQAAAGALMISRAELQGRHVSARLPRSTAQGTDAVQRITITIDDDLLEAIDGLMTQRGYASRSEAFRDIIRDRVDRQQLGEPRAACIATLSYVYDHATRALASRLTHAHHDHHDLTVASMHVHLDHESCLEVSVLRGPSDAVRSLSDSLTTQRGVRHAQLHMIPVQETAARHTHGAGAAEHTHLA
jgi:CopG family transcriptional regulator, nickel-responsive regulator